MGYINYLKFSFNEEAVNIETALELYSFADALDKLARVHGLYKDSLSVEVEGTVGMLRADNPIKKEEWLEQMESLRDMYQEAIKTFQSL